MDASTQTEVFHRLNRANVAIQSGSDHSYCQRQRLRNPKLLTGRPREPSSKRKHIKKRGKRVSLAATHLLAQEYPRDQRSQGTHPQDPSGFYDALLEARALINRRRDDAQSTPTTTTKPRSRHLLIEERVKSAHPPKKDKQRPRVRSISQVPPGSTLLATIQQQARHKRTMHDLFGSDSDEELPTRLWARLERSVTKTDANNNY